jgi:hypothetical protein
MNDDFNRKRMEKFSQMSETERNNMMAIAGSYRTLTPEEVAIDRQLLIEAITTLEHARKFISNRWINMHPDGIELYDECLQKLKDNL